MEEFTGLKCPTCQGELKQGRGGLLECPYCGSHYPRDFSEKKANTLTSDLVQNLNAAQNLHRLGHFDDAAEMYDAITQQYPNEAFAYWGAFLSEYGVQYTEQNKVFRPVCHRISRIPATDSQYLKKLYHVCASEADRQIYRLKADAVESIRYKTYEISRRQEPYDVFLCCGGGRREEEYANLLSQSLKEKGYRVFLPRKAAEGDDTAEAYIFAAIQSAECMLVFAESVESLKNTENTWGRFVTLEGKRIQVLHDGLNESEFPLKLRRTVQLQAPIDLKSFSWLETAVDFVKKPKTEGVHAAGTEEFKRLLEEQSAQRSLEIDRIVNSLMPVANNIDEAFIAMLTYITQGDTSRAEMLLVSQIVRFNNGENGETEDLGGVKLVAELCVELLKLSKSNETERRNIIAKIGTVSSRLKSGYALLSEKERRLYPIVASVRRANLLIYLAKVFGAIKDVERQCFVLDLVGYDMLADMKETNEMVAMLFSLGREREVSEVLRNFSRLDGDYLLPLFLKKFTLGSQKQFVLMSIADKIVCTEKISDELNSYLADCKDLGTALAVVDIMTANRISLTAGGLGGILGTVKEAAQVKRILDNFGKRELSGIEVDMLVGIGTNSDDAANEVLRHLRFDSRVENIGAHNMRLFITKCNLDKIKTRLFEFVLDKKLAEQLFIETVRGNGVDRLSTINILSSFVPVVDIDTYADMMLGKDPLKKEILRIVAPKTGKFASANKTIESFLAGSDSDEDKREIFAMFGEFPFSEQALEKYLAILPAEYDDDYRKWLFFFLDKYPGKARETFTFHYERLIGGYEELLPKIFDRIQYMDNEAIIRFMLDYRGTQGTKDELFCRMIRFLEKPKKIEVEVAGATCNLLQAYVLSAREPASSTQRVVAALKKEGLKPDEKVIFYGKKCKMAEFLQLAEIKEEIRSEIAKYL